MDDRKIVKFPLNDRMKVREWRKEERARMKLNGAAVTRWALTDPTYDCSGATRVQP
ncbi:MAG: hypothetical protein ACYTBJ_27255 [Planctomycetota bacterium]|jgi:hypothetical protein